MMCIGFAKLLLKVDSHIAHLRKTADSNIDIAAGETFRALIINEVVHLDTEAKKTTATFHYEIGYKAAYDKLRVLATSLVEVSSDIFVKCAGCLAFC